MMFYPLFHFFHLYDLSIQTPSIVQKISAFVLFERKRLTPLSCLILLIAVLTTQEEISIFLANKGQIYIVPIFLLEVHDQFHYV